LNHLNSSELTELYLTDLVNSIYSVYMATITLNFKTDKKLKDEAKSIAQDIGLPLGTIMNHYLREFVREKRVVFSQAHTPNVATAKRWDKIMKDIKNGKNLSPRFSSAKEAIAWLEK
jgi:addiction module RelB/DinJ family antitoxin